jgi:hypothetical protein
MPSISAIPIVFSFHIEQVLHRFDPLQVHVCIVMPARVNFKGLPSGTIRTCIDPAADRIVKFVGRFNTFSRADPLAQGDPAFRVFLPSGSEAMAS